MAGVDLKRDDRKVGVIGQKFLKAAFKNGLYLRVIGDTVTISPPLISNKENIDELFEKMKQIIAEIYE